MTRVCRADRIMPGAAEKLFHAPSMPESARRRIAHIILSRRMPVTRADRVAALRATTTRQRTNILWLRWMRRIVAEERHRINGPRG